MTSSTSRTDVQICLQILTIWKTLKSSIEEFATARDLTLQQIFVLYHLYAEDHILMGTLAKHMHCDASNVTGLVDRLQAMHLISRRELPEDRRAKQLEITTEGRELIEQLIPLLPCSLDFSRLSQAEMTELRRMLQMLTV